jgi:hypothetical protein
MYTTKTIVLTHMMINVVNLVFMCVRYSLLCYPLSIQDTVLDFVKILVFRNNQFSKVLHNCRNMQYFSNEAL